MDSAVLRLLDANANRAREALRVIEDYARFVLDEERICAQLKQLRHDLAAALSPLLGAAILHRDTPGDVGTDTKTPSELMRSNITDVVTAAGKRLGEALRCLEEYCKIDSPDAASAIEKLRYRFYDIEQQLAFTLRPAKRFAAVRLCVLITESLCRRPWLEVAQQAIIGGADCLQLREKNLEGGELLCRAKDFVALCHLHKVISIINDRPDVAMLSSADGVHVGQHDLPARQVRRLIGPEMILGVSTHNLEQARQAVFDGADYIGVGPVFPSPTKPRDFLPGLPYAREAAATIRIPTMAIAGINESNVDEVLATGVAGIAVSSAVICSDDPAAAAWRLRQALERRSSGR